jgi:hypothetical protein
MIQPLGVPGLSLSKLEPHLVCALRIGLVCRRVPEIPRARPNGILTRPFFGRNTIIEESFLNREVLNRGPRHSRTGAGV